MSIKYVLMLVSVPPKIHVELLTSDMIVLGVGTSGRCLGFEEGTLMSGISVLRKVTQESSLVLASCEDAARSQ